MFGKKGYLSNVSNYQFDTEDENLKFEAFGEKFSKDVTFSNVFNIFGFDKLENVNASSSQQELLENLVLAEKRMGFKVESTAIHPGALMIVRCKKCAGLSPCNTDKNISKWECPLCSNNILYNITETVKYTKFEMLVFLSFLNIRGFQKEGYGFTFKKDKVFFEGIPGTISVEIDPLKVRRLSDVKEIKKSSSHEKQPETSGFVELEKAFGKLENSQLPKSNEPAIFNEDFTELKNAFETFLVESKKLNLKVSITVSN